MAGLNNFMVDYTQDDRDYREDNPIDDTIQEDVIEPDVVEDVAEEEQVEPDIEETEEKEDLVKVQYLDTDGNVAYDYIPKDKISDIYIAAKQKKDADETLSRVKPYVDRVRESQLLQMIHYYLDQGYTEEQIKNGLPQVLQGMNGQQPQQAKPEFNTVDEEVNYLVEQKIKDYINPIINKQKQIENTQLQEKLVSNNDKVLAKALDNIGLKESELSQEDVTALRKTISDFYPNMNLSMLYLTQAQANGIVRDALRRKVEKGTTAKNVKKATSAPNIMPGKNVKNTANTKFNQSDNVSIDERTKRFKHIFG